eukprot:1141749-Pelagomonas_calceolata.AAC.3
MKSLKACCTTWGGRAKQMLELSAQEAQGSRVRPAPAMAIPPTSEIRHPSQLPPDYQLVGVEYCKDTVAPGPSTSLRHPGSSAVASPRGLSQTGCAALSRPPLCYLAREPSLMHAAFLASVDFPFPFFAILKKFSAQVNFQNTLLGKERLTNCTSLQGLLS